ncbi:MAG: hypothetical protein ACO32A_04915 [Methylophilaceae bacterium]
MNDAIRLTNAVAKYRVGSDGTIRLVQTVVNRVNTIYFLPAQMTP